MSYDSKLIGRRLKEARLEKGMSLREVSMIVNLSDATLSRYENGQVENLKTVILQSLSDLLGVEFNWLIGTSNIKRLEDKHYSQSVAVPIVGQIAAGCPILADENVQDYYSIDARLNVDFALKVRGDSMIGDGICDGDIAFIRKQPVLENGEIGAIIIDEEATLKRFYRDDGHIVLQPSNKDYTPIVITDNNVRIAGKLIAVLNIKNQ